MTFALLMKRMVGIAMVRVKFIKLKIVEKLGKRFTKNLERFLDVLPLLIH